MQPVARPIHPDFQHYLDFKSGDLIELFGGLRAFVLELFPASNELLYHTHALTSVFSLSDKLGDGFCMLPIYTSHLNLGFHQGTQLPDPAGLLQGSGKLIRHIPVKQPADYRDEAVKTLLFAAQALAIERMKKPAKVQGATFSKIKR